MDQQGSVTIAIPGLRSDDPAVRNAAARLIWDRYFRDLLTLARKNLDKRIRLRTTEEDVTQSMFKSFCLRQQRGEFDLAGRDELWKLLVTITLRARPATPPKPLAGKSAMSSVSKPSPRATGRIRQAGCLSNKSKPPTLRPWKPSCSTRRLEPPLAGGWPTPSSVRLRSGGWKDTRTAKSPAASTAPSGRSSAS